MEFQSLSENDNAINIKVKSIIAKFTEFHKEVDGQMVIMFPSGVPVANTWEGSVDPILIGAISAAVKMTFKQLCLNLKRGNLKRLFVNSELGRAIIQNTGPNAILITIMGFEANVIQVAFLTTSVAEQIEKLMVGYEDV